MRRFRSASAMVCAAAAHVGPGAGRALAAPGPRRRARARPAASGRAQAPYDLTGYWVSLVTDDWRYRMLTPPKANADYMPVNAEARRVMGAVGSGQGRSRGRGVPRLGGRPA